MVKAFTMITEIVLPRKISCFV